MDRRDDIAWQTARHGQRPCAAPDWGLTKRYPAVTAVDHLDVEVPAGRVGLVGANGAGKTTCSG